MPRFSIEKRVKIIGKLTNDLRKLASRYDCAILAVNQLTRKICPNAEPNSPSSINAHYQFVPSLGQTWRKNIDFSIILNGDELKGR